MSLGTRLTELRLAKEVSLQVVADAAGVSKAHIWELEKGRAENPTMALLKGLADFYGVSVSYLVGEGEPPGAEPDQIGRASCRERVLMPV